IPEAGKIALLSQSGAIITSLIDWSKSSHLGFSKIFSVGNQAQLSEAELLEFLYQDTETSVIIAYMERLEVNEKLTETLIKYAKKKPTVVLFGGKSHFGAKAALSHTGSVVSSYLSVKTYLSQAGVIIADGLEDLLLFARSFYNNQSISGKRLAIVTNAGGPSIAAADNIAEMNLEMSHFEVKTEEALSKVLRAESNLKNPVDLLGDADEKSYEEAIKIVAKDKNVDGMVVILTPQSSTKINETAEIIAKYKGEKPLFASFVGGEILASAKKIIEESGHPCFSYPEEAVAGMKVLADYSLKKQTILLPHKENNKIFIQAKKDQILHEFNLPVVRYYRIEHEHELDELAEKVGYPIVLKTADETAHKSDIGGVILNIENKFELKKAFLKIGAPAIIGKMVKTKFEIMLGIKKEEHIGTTVLFGSGGIYSEILNDFSFRIAPVNMEMAEAMISETKIGRILDGARDQRKYDLKKLAEIICAAVKFADNFGNIAEVDFNPIIADAENFHLVDIRVITK
ncbi:MAG: acetate--CoA ligase family protein, partial [Candidatus Berkelbacteria bacterium]|nr:acetate--CoA ligase family protein [Candidatus Berkelbacteria bacterium]